MEDSINVLDKIVKPTIERNLISICLKNPNKIIDIKGQEITAEMFLIEANKYIFMAIDYLFYKQQDPTPYAIMEVMQNEKTKKCVEDFGGIEYLQLLTEQRVSENNIDIFCQKLKQAYTRKALYDICEDTQNYLLTDRVEVLNPTEIISDHENKVVELNTNIQQVTEVYHMGDDVDEVLRQRAENPNTVPGLEVGFEQFDYYTNGGQPGDLIMVCARAKTGKSTLLTNWACELGIRQRIPVLYFDTEMSKQEQEDRLLAILSGIPHKEIVSGMFALDTENGTKEEKKALLEKATQQLKDGEYYHIYIPNFTIDKVQAIAKKFKIQKNIQAVFFDYLKFPSSQVAGLKTVQEWQMLGYIASGLKDMAGILGVPVYSGCQENRSNVGSNKKDETNVGGSDRILQLASKLIFLYNKTEEDIIKEGGNNGNQVLYIAFQRSGESNCPPINIRFDRHILTQREV